MMKQKNLYSSVHVRLRIWKLQVNVLSLSLGGRRGANGITRKHPYLPVTIRRSALHIKDGGKRRKKSPPDEQAWSQSVAASSHAVELHCPRSNDGSDRKTNLTTTKGTTLTISLITDFITAKINGQAFFFSPSPSLSLSWPRRNGDKASCKS